LFYDPKNQKDFEDVEMICGTISENEKIQQGIHVICNSSTMESTVVPESPANRRLQEEEPPAPYNTVPINT